MKQESSRNSRLTHKTCLHVLSTIVVCVMCATISCSNNTPKLDLNECGYVVEQSPSDPPPIVTCEEYNRIQVGMTYNEVVSIIKAPGIVESSYSIPGNTTIWYRWVNRNSSNMGATFQNGRLIHKGQFGLP
jgi:hypothetical protein